MSNNAIQFNHEQLAQLGIVSVKPAAKAKSVIGARFTQDTWIMDKHPQSGEMLRVLVHASPDNPYITGESGLKELKCFNGRWEAYPNNGDEAPKPNGFTQEATKTTKTVDWDKQERIGLSGGKQKLSSKQARKQSKRGSKAE